MITAYEADYWYADIRRPNNEVITVGLRLWAPSTYEQALREILYTVAACEPGDTVVRLHRLEYEELEVGETFVINKLNLFKEGGTNGRYPTYKTSK